MQCSLSMSPLSLACLLSEVLLGSERSLCNRPRKIVIPRDSLLLYNGKQKYTQYDRILNAVGPKSGSSYLAVNQIIPSLSTLNVSDSELQHIQR